MITGELGLIVVLGTIGDPLAVQPDDLVTASHTEIADDGDKIAA